MRDLHVKLEDTFYKRGKRAIKALGWATMSEYVRMTIRSAIEQADAHREAEGSTNRSKDIHRK